MRKFIDAVMLTEGPIRQSTAGDAFAGQVLAYMERHLGDWYDDFNDPEIIRDAVEAVALTIEANADLNDRSITICRSELRPQEEIETASFGSLGQFWSWADEGARVCHHDNAYDQFGREDLREIVFVAECPLDAINWVATIAKNLVLKNEREITVKSGSTVMVTDIMSCDTAGSVPHSGIVPMTVYGASDGDF